MSKRTGVGCFRAPALFLPALLWATLGGCATTAPTPTTWQPGNMQPLIVGWQQFFEIVWGVTRQEPDALVDGFITNTWGFPAQEVRVLVNGYDASGTRVGQLIAWGPDQIQPGERVYFDVTVPRGAATYDVSMFSWRWKWPPSGRGEPDSWRTERRAHDGWTVALTPVSIPRPPSPSRAAR